MNEASTKSIVTDLDIRHRRKKKVPLRYKSKRSFQVMISFFMLNIIAQT